MPLYKLSLAFYRTSNGPKNSGVTMERLIQSVRKTMKAILGNQNLFLGLEALRTVFAEVFNIESSAHHRWSKRPRNAHPESPLTAKQTTRSASRCVCSWRFLQEKTMEKSTIPWWLLLEKVDQRLRPNVTTADSRERKFEGWRSRSDGR